jgi:hypothetical protein
VSKLEAQLRALVDEVDGGERPRFEDWENLLAFAFQVAAVEREACAREVELRWGKDDKLGCAKAIRARGGK